MPVKSMIHVMSSAHRYEQHVHVVTMTSWPHKHGLQCKQSDLWFHKQEVHESCNHGDERCQALECALTPVFINVPQLNAVPQL